MNRRRFTIACTLITLGVGAAILYNANFQAASAKPSDASLAPFAFDIAGAASPEDAATALFLGSAKESPKHFVRHLLLGVCDGPIDTLQKFAECLHTTKFHTGDESYTFYDLPKGLDKDTVRVVASREFDSQDEDVAALRLQALSTYYGEKFRSVDVAADGYDGREYRTRVVVAMVQDRWYAIPRCRSSQSFYAIADAMQLTVE